MSAGQTYSDQPAFIDFLAVDVVVLEHRHMKLTSAEKRWAAHRLRDNQNLTGEQIARILHVTDRTVCRMLAQPPPPPLDVDEHGQYVSVTDDRIAV